MLHLEVDPVTHDIVAAKASLENVHDVEVLPTGSTLCGVSWDVPMRMATMTAKPAISLSRAKERQASQEHGVMEKGIPKK